MVFQRRLFSHSAIQLYLFKGSTQVIAEINNKDKQVIVEAMATWAREFSAAKSNSIASLYAPEASLWGTFSPVIRATPESVQNYFSDIFNYDNRKVVFNDFNIRFYGDTAISSGGYTFSLVRAGQKLVIPARYSFTYVKQDGCWLIVEHHSSEVPEDL